MSDIFIGDTGTEIVLDVGVDTSAAIACSISVAKPNGANVTWAAEPFAPTAIRHVTTETDLDIAGRWQLQAFIELPDWQGHGAIAGLDVKRPL